MDPFGWTPEQYTAAGTWVMVVILAVTARFAAGQVKQAAAARQDQSRPFVVPSIDVEQQMLFVLKVENVGKTPAVNVLVQFAEPPRSTLKEIEEVRMLKEPIPTMPPGQKVPSVLGVGTDRPQHGNALHVPYELHRASQLRRPAWTPLRP